MKKSQIIVIALMVLGLTHLSGCAKPEENLPVESTTKETVTELDQVLKEENISILAEKKVEAEKSDYLIFIYSPNCGHCHKVLESSEYQAFTENAKINFYQINGYDVSYDFLNQIDVHSIPTMILIDKVTDNKYEVIKYVGDSVCIDLLAYFTRTDVKE